MLSLSFLTLIRRLFSSSSLSAIRLVSSTYLRLLMFLPSILISACLVSQRYYLAISSSAAPSPFAFSLSQHKGLFKWVSSTHHVAKVLELSTSVLPWFISLWIDWFDLLAAQRTIKSILQQHSSKASVLQCSAFFTIQLSHSYMTTGKAIALTIWTFVSKVMSLLFNTLSRLVISVLKMI